MREHANITAMPPAVNMTVGESAAAVTTGTQGFIAMQQMLLPLTLLPPPPALLALTPPPVVHSPIFFPLFKLQNLTISSAAVAITPQLQASAPTTSLWVCRGSSCVGKPRHMEVTRHPSQATRHLMLHVIQQQCALGSDKEPLGLRTKGQICNDAIPLRHPC
jgi:hypothetical protein